MREALDMMGYVNAAYVVGVVSTLLLVGWSWLAMTRAEAKRDAVRGK